MTPRVDPRTRTAPHGDPLALDAGLVHPFDYLGRLTRARRTRWLDDVEAREGRAMRELVDQAERDVQQRITDRMLYGANYIDAQGRRIDPSRIHAGRPRAAQPIAVAPSAFLDHCGHGHVVGACPLCPR